VKVVVVLARPSPAEEAPARCPVALIRGMMSHGVEVKPIGPRQDYSLQPEPLPDLLVEVIDLAPPRDGCVCRERSGALVNVTLNLVARYARLLDQRGLLQ